MKKSFRGYNCKETEQFIESLKAEYEQKIAALNSEIAEKNSELESAAKKISELEESQKNLAGVLIDAVERARVIEQDYKERAQQSDKYYIEISEQWNAKLKACHDCVSSLQQATEAEYAKLRQSIEQFASWTNEVLDSNDNKLLVNVNTDNTEDINKNTDKQIFDSDEFQKEIMRGAGADLRKACNDLGFGFFNNKKADS